MKDWLKYALIAAGGYVVYKKLTDPAWDISSLLSLAGDSDPSQGASTPSIPVTTATTLSLMQEKAIQLGFGPLGSFDDWNWYYQLVRGVAGPDPAPILAAAGKPREYQMTLGEWASYMGSGLSGLRELVMRGKGMTVAERMVIQ